MSTTASGFFGGGVVWKYELLNGTDTWDVPDAIYGDTILLTMIGGGGSGRAAVGASDGMLGGAGGDCVQRIRYPWASGTNYSTGAAGAAVSPTNNGNPGGATSFGVVSVAGGSGGTTTMSAIIGTPGFIRDGTNGNTHAKNPGGPWGGDGGICHEANNLWGGGGGLVLFTLTHRTNSVTGQGYGAGGGGAVGGASSPGRGGVILVEWQEYA